MKTLSTKEKLQLWHLLMLGLVPVLYTILKLNSALDDETPRILGYILIVIGSVWSAYIIVMTVRRGTREDILKELLTEYRTHLRSLIFLVISDIVLTIGILFLLYEVRFFRQVRFSSDTDVTVCINETPGQLDVLGNVKAGESKEFRVKVGKRRLIYWKVRPDNAKRALLTLNETTALDIIDVPFFWSRKRVPSVQIQVDKEYEGLWDIPVKSEDDAELSAPITEHKDLAMKWGLESQYHRELQAPEEYSGGSHIEAKKGEPLYRYFMVNEDKHKEAFHHVYNSHQDLWAKYKQTLRDDQSQDAKGYMKFLRENDPFFVKILVSLAPVLYFDFIGKSGKEYVLNTIIVRTIRFDEYLGRRFS